MIGEGFEGDTATCIIKATGYKPLTLTLGKTNYSAVLNVAYDKTKSADANDVTLEYRYGDWIIGFKNPADYVGNVLDFKVMVFLGPISLQQSPAVHTVQMQAQTPSRLQRQAIPHRLRLLKAAMSSPFPQKAMKT